MPSARGAASWATGLTEGDAYECLLEAHLQHSAAAYKAGAGGLTAAYQDYLRMVPGGPADMEGLARAERIVEGAVGDLLVGDSGV